MMKKRDITIYDIANELKVSPSTVSRALKNHYSIGAEMKETVKRLAKLRGYRPNHIAASLRRNHTNTIGVLVTWVNRPFISSVIAGVEEVASENGFNVIISQSHDNYENEVANVKTMYDSRVAGLIVSVAMQTMKYDHFELFTSSNIPIVFVDRVAEQFNSDRVVIDNFASGFMATEHLIQQGCRRIAHFAGAQQRNVYRDRQRGYVEALKKYDLPVDESLILHGEVLSAEEGYKMTEQLLSMASPPDGLFTANDTSGVSAIQCAKKRGAKVPHEFAVIGFNNDPVSLIVDPALSTVSHPAADMGKIAVRQILKQREHRDIPATEMIILKTEVIVRESSRRKKVK